MADPLVWTSISGALAEFLNSPATAPDDEGYFAGAHRNWINETVIVAAIGGGATAPDTTAYDTVSARYGEGKRRFTTFAQAFVACCPPRTVKGRPVRSWRWFDLETLRECGTAFRALQLPPRVNDAVLDEQQAAFYAGLDEVLANPTTAADLSYLDADEVTVPVEVIPATGNGRLCLPAWRPPVKAPPPSQPRPIAPARPCKARPQAATPRPQAPPATPPRPAQSVPKASPPKSAPRVPCVALVPAREVVVEGVVEEPEVRAASPLRAKSGFRRGKGTCDLCGRRNEAGEWLEDGYFCCDICTAESETRKAKRLEADARRAVRAAKERRLPAHKPRFVRVSAACDEDS